MSTDMLIESPTLKDIHSVIATGEEKKKIRLGIVQVTICKKINFSIWETETC